METEPPGEVKVSEAVHFNLEFKGGSEKIDQEEKAAVCEADTVIDEQCEVCRKDPCTCEACDRCHVKPFWNCACRLTEEEIARIKEDLDEVFF